MSVQREAVGRARVAEADVVENDGLLEALQRHRAGLLPDRLRRVQVLEDPLRGAERLLEDVVDSGQPLDRLVEQQQGDDEAGELARRSSAPALICVRA